MKTYYEQDADFRLIADSRIAILGYGSQGHAHALNLRDFGAKNVVIGLREGSGNREKAAAAGFEVADMIDAAREADIAAIMIPDEYHADLYRDVLAPNLKEGAALSCAHGLAVHFGYITPRPDLDVFLVAPKGPGHGLRAVFEKGGGLPCLFAAAQDGTGSTRDLAMAYAAGIGCGRAGMIETTFGEECITDMFGEQTVLCGGLPYLILAAFETLVEAGFTPEMAYFECLHEVKLIVDLFYTGGLADMCHSISTTAEYGGHLTGARIVNDQTKAEMRRILGEIRDGSFPKKLMEDAAASNSDLLARRKIMLDHPIEEAGRTVRALMPWLREERLVRTP